MLCIVLSYFKLKWSVWLRWFFFSLTHMHAHTHTVSIGFMTVSSDSKKIPTVSESWVVPPMQYTPKKRRISCTVLSRTKILIYLLLWKNELQKLFRSFMSFRSFYPLALEEGPECCHEKPIASRYSSYNTHRKRIIPIILSTNGYQENRKYFCWDDFFTFFFLNHILCHVLQGNTWNGVADYHSATSRVPPYSPSLVILSDIQVLLS